MARKVIDVSYAQGVIDWDKVKSKVDGVILRCGYGSDRSDQDDAQWARNVKECERLNIPYGVYLYSYAATTGAIQSEINHTLRLLRGHTPRLGVFIDLEENRYGGVAAVVAETFCKAVNSVGYTAGVYCGAYFYRQWLKGVHERIKALWWIAGYGKNDGKPDLDKRPDPGFAYDAWQYTSVGKVAGIKGNVDVSAWYADDAVIKYRAHVQKQGWLPAVENGEVAGTEGKSLRLEAIKITPPEGVTLTVEAHIQKDGWKKYEGIQKGVSSGKGSSANDPIIGTVGQKKRLEAVKIACTRNITGKKVKYQAHVQTYGWMDAVGEGEVAGKVGEAKRLEAIRIWFE